MIMVQKCSSVGVHSDPGKYHDGTLDQFEKYKVNVYIRVKFEIICSSWNQTLEIQPEM